MISAILVLLLLPVINTSKVRSSKFRPIFGLAYWFLVSDFIILGWIGQKPVETPYIEIGMGATIFYFLFLLVLVPLIGIIESKMVENRDGLVSVEATDDDELYFGQTPDNSESKENHSYENLNMVHPLDKYFRLFLVPELEPVYVTRFTNVNFFITI